MTEWKLPESYVFDGRDVRYGVTGDDLPVVVVHGTPWSSFNLRHLIQDAGHLVIEEQPDQLIKKIRPFLLNEEVT